MAGLASMLWNLMPSGDQSTLRQVVAKANPADTYVEPAAAAVIARGGTFTNPDTQYIPPPWVRPAGTKLELLPTLNRTASTGVGGGASGSSRRRQTTDTPAVTATTAPITDTPAVTATTAPAQVAAAPQPVQLYIPPQPTEQAQFSTVRQPTPCELGLGGCQSPEDVSSNSAQWELDPNRQLSLRDKLYEARFMQGASQAALGARQASAAEQYDLAKADPNLNAKVAEEMARNKVPYNVAMANVLYQGTGSAYAQNTLGAPNVMRAVDIADSVNMGINAATGTPFRYNQNVIDYVPRVEAIDPGTGYLRVQGNDYLGTGLNGMSAFGVGRNVGSGGIDAVLGTAMANNQALQGAQKSAAEMQAKSAMEMNKIAAQQQGALTVAQLNNAGRVQAAQIAAEAAKAKAAANGVPTPPVIKLK